jgi:hypothetical protein
VHPLGPQVIERPKRGFVSIGDATEKGAAVIFMHACLVRSGVAGGAGLGPPVVIRHVYGADLVVGLVTAIAGTEK